MGGRVGDRLKQDDDGDIVREGVVPEQEGAVLDDDVRLRFPLVRRSLRGADYAVSGILAALPANPLSHRPWYVRWIPISHLVFTAG